MKKPFPSILILGFCCLFSCKKSDRGSTSNSTPQPPVDTSVVIQPPIEPAIANTIGFFMDDWKAKTFIAPSYKDTAIASSASNTVTINPSAIITKIPRSVFGNNANLWMSQIVTEPSLVTNIGNLNTHIIRFPGGSISDVYFWNAPKNTPPSDVPNELINADGTIKTMNASSWWFGKNAESWTFSVDNYYNLLQQTGNTGMITINYGYARYGTGANPVAAAAHLAADWVRYDNGRTKYWEIGNENYGDWEAGYRIDINKNKDGQPQYVSGELYGQHFRIFADSMKKAAQEIGKTIYIGAVMAEAAPQSWETNTRKTWNTGLLNKAANTPEFFIVHNYYTPYNANSGANEILASAETETKKVMDYATQTIQTAGVNQKPIALTEYNIFAVGSMQQVSHINGIHATMVLGEALKNKYGMIARWDLANSWDNGNDHGLFSQGPQGGTEPGVAAWTPRPAFYHLYYFQKFSGDRLVTSISTTNDIISYSSSFTSGQVGSILVNKSLSAQSVQLTIQNYRAGDRFYWYTLTGDGNEFSRKVFINGKGSGGIAGGPEDYTSINAYSASTANGIKLNLPARSVIYLVVDKK